MFGITPRMYVFIGIVVGIVVYLIGIVGGPQIVSFLTEIEQTARINGVAPFVTTIALGPFIFAFSEPLFGAIMAALLWPFIIIWFFFLFAVLIISAFLGGYNSAATGADNFNQ